MNLIKIRGDFMSERDADAAIEKISAHCHSIRILYNGAGNREGGYFESYEPNFYDYGVMSGINTGWGLSPFGSYNFEHTRSYNYLSSLGIGKDTGKAVVEADVAPEKYELVKERLYSLGALSVT